jgi:hypothetical protein
MAKSKNIHRVEMTEGKRSIIQQLLQEYDIETAEDIQDALKGPVGRNHQGNDGSRDGTPSWL